MPAAASASLRLPGFCEYRRLRLALLLLGACALAGLIVTAADIKTEKALLNIHRVEIRVADPDTQCDNNPDWLVEMEDAANYAGLLEFGTMEETGFFSMAGYDFE